MLLTEPQVGFVSLLKKNKAFRRIWLAQIVSELGDWFNLVALLLLLKKYTPHAQEAHAAALLLIVEAIPAILWSPLAGIVADRFNRKQLMIAADLSRAVIVLGFLLVRDSNTIWLLYVLSAAHFSISAFFEPARSAIIPQIASRAELEVANGLSGATWSVMLAVGAALGGFLTFILPLPIAFIIDSFSFLGSALLLWKLSIPKAIGNEQRIHTQPIVTTNEESAQIEQNKISSLRELFQKKPKLFSVLLIKTCLALTGGAAWYLGAIYGQRVFPSGQDGSLSLGILYASCGLGSLLGTLLVQRFSATQKHILLLSYAARVPVFLLFAFSSHLLLAALALFIQSVSGSFLWVASTTLLQKNTPHSFQGRLFSMDFAGHTIGFTLSNLIPAQFLAHFLEKSNFSWQIAASKVSFGLAGFAGILALLWVFVLYGSSSWKTTKS